MKKTGMVCVAVMCLAMQGISSTPINPLPSEKMAAEIRKDPAKLKECIEWYMVYSPTGDHDLKQLKRLLGLTNDKVMQGVVMNVIRKAGVKVRWQDIDWNNVRREDERDTAMARAVLTRGFRWMELCADAEGKKFLMGIATDNAKFRDYRVNAFGAYMNCAAAQEKWDAIARFLADDMRAQSPPVFNAYPAAIQAYDEAEGDTQKRGTIVATVSAALAKEESKETFEEADKMLAERSAEWAGSPQRKAALERFGKPHAPEVP